MHDHFSFFSNQIRRLPVYLLLDCSRSMAGEPIDAVNAGLGMIYRELMKDPQAIETVYISVITYADRADQTQLTPIDQFTPPQLSAGGSCSLGAALQILVNSIEQDLVPTTEHQRGDYRPIVFLLTAGQSLDESRSKIFRLHSLSGSLRPTVIALGCGPNVNMRLLHEITENVLLMHTVTPDRFRAFFKWISGSITHASHPVGAGHEAQLKPPSTIPGITYWSPDDDNKK